MAGLKALDAKLPAGAWLLAYDFDNLLQGGDLSMTELDGVSKDRPIFIWYINMHDGAANSAAFKIADIPSNVGVLPGGGHFGRNSDGSFNGLVYEESAMLKFVTKALPPITPQVFAKAMTGLLQVERRAWLHHHPRARHRPARPGSRGWSSSPRAAPAGSAPASSTTTSRRARPTSISATGQGDALPELALLAVRHQDHRRRLEPDPDRRADQALPQHHREGRDRTTPPADLKTMVAAVKAAGWPVQIHCNGDATIDDALDAIEAAYGANPRDRAQPHRALDHGRARTSSSA